jgi:hypothetical protein
MTEKVASAATTRISSALFYCVWKGPDESPARSAFRGSHLRGDVEANGVEPENRSCGDESVATPCNFGLRD